MMKYKIDLYLDDKIIYTNNLKEYKNILQNNPFKLYKLVNGDYICEGIY